MRILLLVNNWVGWKVSEFLTERGEQVVGAVLHPEERRKYGVEIRETLKLPESSIFDAAEFQQGIVFQRIAALEADLVLSIYFGYLLKEAFINHFSGAVINLHPALLPYNRGSYPNVWSIIEQTPAGATLHYIDPGIDTGDIIAQKQVVVESVDTGQTLYRKLERASLELFKSSWAHIKAGNIEPRRQAAGAGTSHRLRDIVLLDRIDLDTSYPARTLINLLRARTFPPFSGAYFIDDSGKRVNIRVELEYDEG